MSDKCLENCIELRNDSDYHETIIKIILILIP